MGAKLRDLVTVHEISWEDLRGKTIAIDALNNLYQFLAIIRQPDGTVLMDDKGRTTSHLSSLFYRTIRVMENGIKPCYVYDGKPPEQKEEELMMRRETKEKAREKWQEAKDAGDLAAAKRYASMTSRFTSEMLQGSKDLLDAMGIPIVQAPSEGEMQCAHMVKTGKVYATGSQDYDTLLFGSPILIKNLTMVEKFQLERLFLDEVLENLGLTQEELIDVAILTGTDFNSGIYGIGPKKALKAVKEKKINEIDIDFDMDEIREIFLKPKTTDDYNLEWKAPDKEKIKAILSDKHNFSVDRVEKASKRLEKAFNETVTQSSLSSWV